MHGVARRNKDIAAGQQIGRRQNFVFVEGELWMVKGDINQPHGVSPHVPGPDQMAQGSSFISIQGIPICREGHLAGCGHPTTGSRLMYAED
jgi:uncharacterized Zn-binding protein involved in type VI secretion